MINKASDSIVAASADGPLSILGISCDVSRERDFFKP